MKASRQRYRPGTVLNLCSLAFVLLATAIATGQSAEPNPPSTAERESKPVLLSRLDLDRLQGEIICIYNFSSW